MTLKKISGSKIFIGSKVTYKDTVVAADFTGQTWTEIKNWIEAGELGVEQEVLSQLMISSGITQYAKGAISFPQMTNVFVPEKNDPGQAAFAAAIKSCHPYAFKIEWGADCGEESVVTISNAAPGVITWNSHGLPAGTPVVFQTTGALPTGLTAGTTYYVAASPAPAANTFSVAATPGGAAIDTTTAGSGVHTAYAQPIGETDLLFGLALDGAKAGGDGSANRTRTFNIQPICRSLEV